MSRLIYCNLSYGKCSKISNNFLLLFSNKMLVIKDRNNTMLTVRIANREDTDQTEQSNLGLQCLSRLINLNLVLKILNYLPYSKTCVKRTLKNRQNKGLF